MATLNCRYSYRSTKPLKVTPVSPGEDIAGIHNGKIFVMDTAKIEAAVSTDYKFNEVSVTFLPKSGAEDKMLQISLDSTQGIQHVMAKVASDNFEYCRNKKTTKKKT